MEKNKWKVEIRDTCKVCGGPLPNARYRTYCSTKCRVKANNKKQADSGYNKKWQKDKRDKVAVVPSDKKCQCLICGKWYVQVCSHVYQVHGMTGREYREYFELEVKRGVVPDWYRKVKGDQAIDNETYKNLVKGAKFRFKKGQEGVGVYKRSPITLERLKNQHKS
jgi:hypothetical protein